MTEGCHVSPDEDDNNRQTLFLGYPTLYPSDDVAYVFPRVRIEAGVRSALDPSLTCTVTPYIADELPDWSFNVDNIRVIAPERTYWGKAADITWRTLRIPRRGASADRQGPGLAPLLRCCDDHGDRNR